MDRAAPAGAALLLDFIASFEAPKGYDTVYANRMARTPKSLTSMMLSEMIAQGPWRTRTFGSSACGRYQLVTATLQDPRKEMALLGGVLFSADPQGRLGYHLLKPGDAVTLAYHGLDTYARIDADILMPNGQSFGAAMIASGRAFSLRG